MTTRNITKQFEQLRMAAKSSHASLSGGMYNDRHSSSLLDGSNMSTDINALGGPKDDMDMMMYNPPKWVDIAEQVKADLESIDQYTAQLDQAYNNRLKVSFGNEDEERAKEQAIDSITHNTTMLIKNIENKIKSIAFCDDVPGQMKELSNNEKTLRLNVMRSLGGTLQSKSKQFKNQQRDFLQRLQKQQNIGNDLFSDLHSNSGRDLHDIGMGNDGGLILDMALDQGLTEQQQIELNEIKQRADEREQEIIRLAENINELATLFQDLNVLVIEQGTILDRIDYNVEQTVHNVQAGRVELEKAEEYSKSNWILKAILILLVVIVVELILLVIKYKLRH
eukprot:UN01012